MDSTQSTIGWLTIAIALVSYSFYYRDVITGKTRPHIVTWGIWSGLSLLITLYQIGHGAEAGAWVTGFTGIAAAGICAMGLRSGDLKVTRIDGACLAGAALAGIAALALRDDTVTVALASTVFVLGMIPTIRKSYQKPHQETVITYALNSLKFSLALLALGQIDLVTATYPATLALANGLLVALLVTRRTAATRRA